VKHRAKNLRRILAQLVDRDFRDALEPRSPECLREFHEHHVIAAGDVHEVH